MWAKSSWCLEQRRRTRAGAGGPSGPGRGDAGGPRIVLVTRLSHISSSITSRSALSPPKVSVLMTFPLPCSVSLGRAAPSPPSCPRKRLGSDHLDVWALPTGQGGSEGGRLLPAPTLSLGLLCCFCAKVSRSLSVQFCVLPPRPHLPLLPPAPPRPTPPRN